jgi:hypothetical protein
MDVEECFDLCLLPFWPLCNVEFHSVKSVSELQERIPQAATGSNNPEEDIRSEQMALLIEQSYPAACISLVVAAVLVAILWPAQSPAHLLTWYGAFLACGMLRLAVFIAYRRSPAAPSPYSPPAARCNWAR